jgi:hypothetical protein
LENPAAQIIRQRFSHQSSIAESIAKLILAVLPAHGYTYLGSALVELYSKAEPPNIRSEKRPLLEDDFGSWINSLVEYF